MGYLARTIRAGVAAAALSGLFASAADAARIITFESLAVPAFGARIFDTPYEEQGFKPAQGASEQKMSEAELEALRALGYIGQ